MTAQENIDEIISILRKIRSAWVYEANQGDGIMKKHASILSRANAILVRENK
jgi:hypothetical protein